MCFSRLLIPTAALAIAVSSSPLAAQVREVSVVSLAGAKAVIAAAEAEAERNGWNVAIAIVDPAGELVLFHRRDGTQIGSVDIAIAKARTAARFRRPTKALDDAVAGGRLALTTVDGLIALEGGVPLEIGGVVVGAIGVSGVTSQQDAQVATAGAAALQP